VNECGDVIMRNIKVILEYDGTMYHGWQRQSDTITVQQVLEESIGIITQERIRVTGSGRTDAGVHAVNQVANFKTDSKIDVKNLIKGINSLLPYDMVIKEIADVNETFHARYDAISKVYCYQIYNKPVRSALYRNYAWYVREPLDVEMMKEAAVLLKGTFDFSSFCAANCGIKNHVRTIMNIDIEINSESMLRIFIEADGFLKYMVRNIVGVLVDIGKRILFPLDLLNILEAKDRTQARITAPACGLFLKEVRY
jgi:tRNA pseudouridine38-40 synthase